MIGKHKHIVVGITGASGSIYAQNLLIQLKNIASENNFEISVVFSKTGKEVALFETGKDFVEELGFKVFENHNFYAPFASGSSSADALIVVPCSMGTLGRIAHGTSDNLICRTADVVLKEHKKLILVLREAPFNLIHIKNMELVSLAGGIILPASPSFYSKPQNIDELVNTVVYRIVDLIGLNQKIGRWGD
jgi:flavin prenyltransferase